MPAYWELKAVTQASQHFVISSRWAGSEPGWRQELVTVLLSLPHSWQHSRATGTLGVISLCEGISVLKPVLSQGGNDNENDSKYLHPNKAMVREEPAGQVGEGVWVWGLLPLQLPAGAELCHLSGAHWDSLLQMDLRVQVRPSGSSQELY